MTLRVFIVGLLRLLLGIGLTGALAFGAFFAIAMVACTGGGALIIIIPVAIVVLPAYYMLMRKLFGGFFRRSGAGEQAVVTLNPLEQYIADMRKLGIDDKDIVSNLVGVGWEMVDINPALKMPAASTQTEQ